MSRNSWSSTGSDAEVRHHFDQPFDYDPRRYLDQLNSSASRDSIVDDEAEASDDGTQFDFSRQSHDSFEAVSDHPPDEDTSNLPPASDYLDDTHDQSNQAICRICLESSSNDAAGGESLGRLLSPCRCKGTMKYVHATCLDQWRAASARSSSAVACDQCGAPYRFRKSKFVGLATSPTLLFVVSLFLFLLLIWTVGVVATFCMDLYDRPTAIKTSPKAKSRSWWPWRSAYDNYDADLMPLQNDAWSYLDADYSTPGMWSYSTLMYEPAAYVKLIKEAVRSFASGEAVDAVREVVGLQDSGEAQQAVQDDLQEECGFWSALKHEWMYGDGGLWQRSASSSSSSPAQIAQDAGSSGSNADTSRSSPPKERSRERYDARAASDANDVDAIRRRRERSAKKARRTNQGQPAPQGWLSKLFVQFSVGFSLVGILSFVNLLVGASFLGPINLHNFGLGRSFARMTSGGRGRNGNQEGVNIASILIVLLVLIGVVRALHVVYKLVRKGARRGLSRLEAVIVDWNADDDGAVAAGDVVTATDDRVGDAGHRVHVRQAFVQEHDD